jgi:phage-related holin
MRFQNWIFSLAIAPFVGFVETYLFSDWQFLRFLGVLIALDTGLGMAMSWRTRRISSNRFARLFQKSIVYLTLLVLVHVLCHFTVEGQRNQLFDWFSSFVYAAIMVREGISILEHLASLNPKLLPPWILQRLLELDKHGNYTNPKPANHETEQEPMA